MVRIALFIGGVAALMIAYAPLLLKDENCCFKERKKERKELPKHRYGIVEVYI
jgi:hypothetical protein